MDNLMREVAIRQMLIDDISRFVNENGEDYNFDPDHWVNLFGMDNKCTDKVFSFYDSEHGCWFTEEIVHDDKENMYDRFCTSAVMAIYTMCDGELMCYMLSNSGIVYNSDLSDSYHCFVDTLSTQAILEIYYATIKAKQ